MPIGAELFILGSLLYLLYLMTRSDPNWIGHNDRRQPPTEGTHMADYQERDPAAPFTAKDCVVSISVNKDEEVVDIDVLEANGARHQWGVPLPSGRQNDYQPFWRLSYEPVGCGRCARCEEEQKVAEYQQTGDRVGYLTRRLVTCPKCGSKRCPKAADHRNTCQKETDQ